VVALAGGEQVAKPALLFLTLAFLLMRKTVRLSKKLAAVAITATVALTGTAAFAYWTTSGSGGGSGSAGTGAGAGTSAVTVTQVGTLPALTPGSGAQAINFQINNGLSTHQSVSSVSVSIDDTVWNTAFTGCSADDFTLVQPSATNNYSDLSPGATVYSPSGASLALKDTSGNQNGCKSQAIVLTFAAI
jgi:hypothetical protein